MIKKLLVGLIIVLFIPLCAGAQAALPQVGDTLYGFTVAERGTLDMVGAQTALLTHDRSGATVLVVKNQDINRAFDITFRTPALDDRGTSHVFEHVCINGSDKYPAQNLFFALNNLTYNTFTNAMTSQNMTTYPVASLSQDQLLTMMDVYMSGVLHPMVYEERRLADREAWRYELSDPAGDITLNGTVYSEMKGSYTLNQAGHFNLQKTLMPGTIAGNVSGGTPRAIPDLTWEALLDYHRAYYHPSNALIILYGDIDQDRFLEALDRDYLSHYEKKDIEIDRAPCAPLKKTAVATFEFPVTADAQAQNGAVAHYALSLPGATREDVMGMQVLCTMLSHESSDLAVAVRQQLPAATLGASVDSTFDTPYLYLTLTGANPGDQDALMALADRYFAQLAQDGPDGQLCQAVLSQLRYSTLTMGEASNLGVNLAVSIAQQWANGQGLNYFGDYVNRLEAMQAKGAPYFQALAAKYLGTDNGSRALVLTQPALGQAEKEAQALEKKLAAYKASLSQDQVTKLVQDSQALAAWSGQQVPRQVSDKLQAVTAASLPEEVRSYHIQEVQAGGATRLSARADVDDIGMTALLLDTSFVPVEDLPYLNLMASLTGALGTGQYDRGQVSQKLWQQVSSFGVNAQALKAQDGTLQPVLVVSWLSLMDQYQENLDLIDEVLFATDFSDTDMIARIVESTRAALAQSMTAGAVGHEQMRALATGDALYAYLLPMTGIDYMHFLDGVLKLLDQRPQAVTDKLTQLQQALRNRQNAIALFAGNDKGIRQADGALEAYLSGLPQNAIVPAGYQGIPLPAMREAVQVDLAVQFNILYASLDQLGVEEDGKFAPLCALISDLYLTPRLRQQLGAYSVLCSAADFGMLMQTYRDPGVADSFKVFEGAGDFLRGLELDQQAIDPYILSSYSQLAAPQGALSGALAAMLDRIRGDGPEKTLEKMRQMKALAPKDLATMAGLMDKMSQVGARATWGGQAAIDKNKDMYDVVLTPLAP